jgi:hypothetical protein
MTLDQDTKTKVEEIQKLLFEAYSHYFCFESHIKAGEGVISLHFPSYLELREGVTEPSVEIITYCLSKDKENHFESIDKALEAVRQWHREELSYRRDLEDLDFAKNEEYNTKFAKF